ncbi:DUF302 domain-containing protein [bacterium]|nr:DUF302 domain-containing protein [bacterium]MBU1990413.1 DUF302 domain-containing protein [bacterium]
MKKIVVLIVALLCAVSLYAQGDLHIFDVNNKEGKITTLKIEEAFTSKGFTLGVNSEMNLPFNKQFKQTDFKVFTLLTVYHTALAQDLIKKYPQAGVFTPMGIGIYQGLNEDTLHVSALTSDAQAKILGIDNDEILKQIEKDVLKVLNTVLEGAKHRYSEDSLKESRALVTKFEFVLDGDEWEDAKEELEMNLEAGFEPFGFVMPSFLAYNDELTQEGTIESPFDFYDTYSICKLKVIYTVSKSRPEAAAFAPCTLMVYKKKGENKIVLGFPAVYNWMSSAKVQDKAAQKVLLKAQKDFESILRDVTE